jgi:hypothetical protein
VALLFAERVYGGASPLESD